MKRPVFALERASYISYIVRNRCRGRKIVWRTRVRISLSVERTKCVGLRYVSCVLCPVEIAAAHHNLT
jgi:hypothetical protein